jgi:hypothetical protein
VNDCSRLITTLLLWLGTGFTASAFAAVCDVDNDGDVDRLDLRLIASARNLASHGPDDARDADGDGAITQLDLRACIRQCNSTGCEVIESFQPAPGDEALGSNSPPGAWTPNAGKDSVLPAVTGAVQSSDVTQGRAKVGGTKWKVKHGDTLFSISRALFPLDTGKQLRLRQDIVVLNPSVFVNGANDMATGAVLELPGYVVFGPDETGAVQPLQATSPAVAGIASSMAPRSVDVVPRVEPATAKPGEAASTSKSAALPASKTGSRDDPLASERQSTAAVNPARTSASLSLGYSSGGDKLADLDGGDDPYAGSGVHLRLGFEQISRRGGGYRVALGLQYDPIGSSSDNSSYRDAYLQLAFQYGIDPLVYGIGAVIHTGATLSGEFTREYDPAAGAVVYLENVGNGGLSGWGLSYTYLQIEEQQVAKTFDASRAELYYSWRF